MISSRRRQGHLAARLERLAGFAAVFEAAGFVAGEHVTPASAPGVWAMPYARYHPEVDRFVGASLMGAFQAVWDLVFVAES